MRTARIFISSPGDVQLERQIARRVLQQLQGELGDELTLEPYFWEYEPMRLTRDFQSQIPRTSSFDIVVCILWSRLGSVLGPEHRRPDGTPYQSGTEFEFEDAAESFRARGTPDILVYRNRTDPPIKPRPKEERERQLAQFDALEAFLERWTRDGEVFKGAITGYTDLGQFEEQLAEHLRRLIRARFPDESPLDVERPRVTWTAGSPFRGLQTFEFEHAPVFQGRTRAIQDVIAMAREQRLAQLSWLTDAADRPSPPAFVLISAMSGIGKSSLVRAGVLPLITVPGVIEGVGVWRRAVVTPTTGLAGPLEALAAALVEPEALPELISDGTPISRLVEYLRGNPAGIEMMIKGGLSQAAANVVVDEEAQLRRWEDEFTAQGRVADAEHSRRQRESLTQHESCLILMVDQMEELLSGAAEAAEKDRTAFFQVLDSLSRSGRAMVVATMRSDFFARAVETPVLSVLMNDGVLYQLQPPTTFELAQIIRDPAREAGLTFEEDAETGSRLDDVLLSATQADPAALPLLEFTLDQLYQRREASGLLTHRAYRELNGVEGALALRAEEEFAALPVDVQAEFGQAFSALVNLVDALGEERPVRRRAEKGEFPSGSAALELVERFARARLLVIDQDAHGAPSVSVVHEALFSRWDRLRTWIDLNRDLLRVRVRAESEAQRWDEAGRPRDLLLQGGRPLVEAQDLLTHRDLVAVSGRALMFIEESTAADRVRRRRRSIGLSALVSGIAVALVVSFFQIQSLNQNRIEGKLLDYRNAVREAESQFLTHTFMSEESKLKALQSAQRVLQLQNEITEMRGSPPEQSDVGAAQAYEYLGVLKLELGDPDGSLQDFEERAKILKNVDEEGSRSGRGRLPINSNVLTVLDLQMELFVANEHLKSLLRQNDLLREALVARGVISAPPIAAGATVPTETAEERSRKAVTAYKSFAALFDYLTREYPRPQDFNNLLAVTGLTAREYQSLARCCDTPTDNFGASARQVWEARVSLAQRGMVWLRSASLPAKQSETNEAAEGLMGAYKDLALFHLERRDFQSALETSRNQLAALDSEPELKDASSARMTAHQNAAGALAGLGQPAAAALEIDESAAAVIVPSRSRLARGYQELGAARGKAGNYPGAVDALRQRLEVLKLDGPTDSGVGPSELQAAYLGLSWYQILARQFREAQVMDEEGLLLPISEDEKAELSLNLAHALLFQGSVDRAMATYEAWMGHTFPPDKSGSRSFAKVVQEDLTELEKSGLTHAQFPAIRALISKAISTP